MGEAEAELPASPAWQARLAALHRGQSVPVPTPREPIQRVWELMREGGRKTVSKDVLDKLHRHFVDHGRRRRVWKENQVNKFTVLAHRDENAVEITTMHKLSKKAQIDASASASDDLLVEAHVRGTSLVDRDERTAISLDLGSNLLDNYRLALEGAHGNDVDGHSVHVTLSLDKAHGLAGGLATTHSLSPGATLFSRAYRGMGTAGQLVLQSVHQLSPQDCLSPVCAASIGGAPQAGLTWTRSLAAGVRAEVPPPGGAPGGEGAELPGGGAGDGGGIDQVSLQCFVSGKGARSLTVRMSLGRVDAMPPLRSHHSLMG